MDIFYKYLSFPGGWAIKWSRAAANKKGLTAKINLKYKNVIKANISYLIFAKAI